MREIKTKLIVKEETVQVITREDVENEMREGRNDAVIDNYNGVVNFYKKSKYVDCKTENLFDEIQKKFDTKQKIIDDFLKSEVKYVRKYRVRKTKDKIEIIQMNLKKNFIYEVGKYKVYVETQDKEGSVLSSHEALLNFDVNHGRKTARLSVNEGMEITSSQLSDKHLVVNISNKKTSWYGGWSYNYHNKYVIFVGDDGRLYNIRKQRSFDVKIKYADFIRSLRKKGFEDAIQQGDLCFKRIRDFDEKRIRGWHESDRIGNHIFLKIIAMTKTRVACDTDIIVKHRTHPQIKLEKGIYAVATTKAGLNLGGNSGGVD